MTSIVTALRWVARIDGLIALVLGILLWGGSASSLRFHITTGFVMTLVLLMMGILGFFVRMKPVLPGIAIAWAILLPYVGFAQLKVMPGASHMVIQVVHLLIGVGAIGLTEAMAAKMIRQARA